MNAVTGKKHMSCYSISSTMIDLAIKTRIQRLRAELVSTQRAKYPSQKALSMEIELRAATNSTDIRRS